MRANLKNRIFRKNELVKWEGEFHLVVLAGTDYAALVPVYATQELIEVADASDREHYIMRMNEAKIIVNNRFVLDTIHHKFQRSNYDEFITEERIRNGGAAA